MVVVHSASLSINHAWLVVAVGYMLVRVDFIGIVVRCFFLVIVFHLVAAFWAHFAYMSGVPAVGAAMTTAGAMGARG